MTLILHLYCERIVNMQEVLITWWSWFIWKKLIVYLKHKWFKVYCLIREETDVSFFINENIDCFLYKDDTCLNEFFSKKNISMVIHLATHYIVQHDIWDIYTMIDSNISLWTKVIEAASNHNVKYFINTSSFIQNYENKKYSPVNLYAAMKEAFEDIWLYYAESWRINFITLSLVNTYWIWDNRKKIFNIWKNAINKNISINSTRWEQFIDILYIDDVVDAYSKLIDHLSANTINHKKYAVSSWNIMTLKKLSLIFEEVIWEKINIQRWAIEYREREVMYPYNIWEKIPGWSPKINVKEWIKLFFWD
jgi:nucleoside-diphosphate-sugar epimerase